MFVQDEMEVGKRKCLREGSAVVTGTERFTAVL